MLTAGPAAGTPSTARCVRRPVCPRDRHSCTWGWAPGTGILPACSSNGPLGGGGTTRLCPCEWAHACPCPPAPLLCLLGFFLLSFQALSSQHRCLYYKIYFLFVGLKSDSVCVWGSVSHPVLHSLDAHSHLSQDLHVRGQDWSRDDKWRSWDLNQVPRCGCLCHK